MSLPALQLLCTLHPQAHIAILARPWVAGLYSQEPFCDELIPYDAQRGWNDLRSKWQMTRQLKSGQFDCAILLQNAFEAAALVRLAGIPHRIGYARDGRSHLLTRAIRTPKPGETPPHQRFYYLELLKRSGLIDSYPLSTPIRLSSAPALAAEGRRRFAAASVFEPVIGVSPGAAYGGAKRWLPERFAQAALQVAHDRHASVAVFGSRQEFAICEAVREQIESAGTRCLNFAGVTSLPEFIELAAACEAFLTNDSGPMHIASALGIPTVAIFGATDHTATGPTGDSAAVIREPVSCSPCLLRECPIDHRCMTAVTADRVAQSALRLLQVRNR